MGAIEVLSRTQKIIVESPSSVRVVNAGPVGSGRTGPSLPGPKGDKGDTGLQGIQGIQGVQGNPGADGADSVVPGPKGNQGDQGIPGTPGADSTVPGPKGDKGDQGDQGIQGIQGIQGVPGVDGIDGADSEVPGPPGLQGIQGVKGDTGNQGIQGIQGVQGVQGFSGPSAASMFLPAGAIAQTVDRRVAGTNFAALVSGQVTMVAIWLPMRLISSITFQSGTQALVGGLNQWFVLTDAALAKLAVTVDDTTTPWGAGARKTLTITGGFTPSYEGVHFLGAMIRATTVPSLVGQAATTATKDIPPVLSGLSSSGLTNPASCPTTLAALATGHGATEFAYVS